MDDEFDITGGLMGGIGSSGYEYMNVNRLISMAEMTINNLNYNQ